MVDHSWSRLGMKGCHRESLNETLLLAGQTLRGMAV